MNKKSEDQEWLNFKGFVRIPHRDLKCFDMIARNPYHSIYKATREKEEIISVIMTRSINGENEIKQTAEVVKSILALSHKNLVKPIGYDYEIYRSKDNQMVGVFYVMSEKIERSLTDLIHTDTSYFEFEDNCFQFLLDILSSYFYLREKNLFHLDLRKINVFVENNTFKLALPRLYQNEDIIYREDHYFIPEKYKIGFVLLQKPMDWVKSKIDPEKGEIYCLGNLLLSTLKSKNTIIDFMIKKMIAEDPQDRMTNTELFIYWQKNFLNIFENKLKETTKVTFF